MAVSMSPVSRVTGRMADRVSAQVMKVRLDPLRLFLFLLTIINVSRIHQHYRVIAKLRPALLLSFFTFVYAFLNRKQIRTENLFESWVPKLIIALAVFACAAAPFGISLGNSGMFVLTSYSKVIIYALLLVVAIRSAQDLYTLVWAYVISAAVLSMMALFLFHLSKASGTYATRLSDLYTFDANDVGLVLMIGLGLALLTFQTSRGFPKLFSLLTLAGIGASLARSGSRGAFVGLLVVGGFLLVMLNSVPLVKRVAFVVVTVIALILGAPPGYWKQMGTIFTPTTDYNWETKDGRREVAKRGIGYMISHPIFGLGINNFSKAECFMSDKAMEHVAGTGLRCTPPHNSYVEAGAELGIPGLGMFLALVFGSILSMLRLRRRLPRGWLHGDAEQRFLYLATMYLALAMVGFAVTAFFLTFAWIDMVYIVAALITGCHVLVAKKLREGAPVKGAPGTVAAAAPPASAAARRRLRNDQGPVSPAFLIPPAE